MRQRYQYRFSPIDSSSRDNNSTGHFNEWNAAETWKHERCIQHPDGAEIRLDLPGENLLVDF
jgi:hypothetical protein